MFRSTNHTFPSFNLPRGGETGAFLTIKSRLSIRESSSIAGGRQLRHRLLSRSQEKQSGPALQHISTSACHECLQGTADWYVSKSPLPPSPTPKLREHTGEQAPRLIAPPSPHPSARSQIPHVCHDALSRQLWPGHLVHHKDLFHGHALPLPLPLLVTRAEKNKARRATTRGGASKTKQAR